MKGDPNSDLVVRFVDDIVGDREAKEMTNELCTNVVHWVELFLKKRYNMILGTLNINNNGKPDGGALNSSCSSSN